MSETYVEVRPSAALANVVRTLWVQRTGDTAYLQRHLPTGGVELHFPLGGPAQIVGPLTGHRLEVIPARTTVVGVRFAPGAPPPLPVALDELVDQLIPLTEVWGSLGDRIADELALVGEQPEGHLRAVALLEAALLREYRAARRIDGLVREAVGALMPWDPLDVGTVAARLGLSESQLRRRSLNVVGVSPKVLQRVLRFQGFLALAQARAAASGRRGEDGIAGLSVDVGYADQAHLTRECVRLTGLTPRRLLHGDIDRCACGHDHSASYLPFLAGRKSALSHPPARYL